MRLLTLSFLALLSACASGERTPSSPKVTNAERLKFQREYVTRIMTAAPKAHIHDAEFIPGCGEDRDHEDGSCLGTTCALGPYNCKNYASEVERAAQVCKGVSGRCIQDTCAIGPYNCKNYASEVERVAALCHGLNPSCVKALCSMGPYNCANYASEVDRVVALCQSGVDGRCLEDTCALGAYNCKNYASEVERAAALCRP